MGGVIGMGGGYIPALWILVRPLTQYRVTNCYGNCLILGWTGIFLISSKTYTLGLTCGVRQGCILSPLLFNIFLSDLPQILGDAAQSSGAGAGHPSSLFWADDIVMFSESEEGLRGMLGALEKYCGDNELTLNTDKTKCMIFNKGGRLLRTPLYYGGKNWRT